VGRVFVFLGEEIGRVVSASGVDNINLAPVLRFSDCHVSDIDVTETVIGE